tara:strand:- start:2110 stop:2322 length:213 start_codon:yes stop_codon:yes gene_type:complete
VKPLLKLIDVLQYLWFVACMLELNVWGTGLVRSLPLNWKEEDGSTFELAVTFGQKFHQNRWRTLLLAARC